MRRGVLLVGFGLGGLALAMGLSLGAFALTGNDIGTPARPIVAPSQSDATPGPSRSPESERTHEPTGPSASATPSDDHGDSSGTSSSSTSSGSSSGSGSSGSGSGTDDSPGDGSGSGDDHPDDD